MHKGVGESDRDPRKLQLQGATDTEKLHDLNSKCYADQACYFLNTRDPFDEKEAEQAWKYCQRMAELDESKGNDGCVLGEFDMHRFLESFQETKTVREMRTTLRENGMEDVRQISLSQFFVFKYSVD